MSDVQQFLDSGILELYVLGQVSPLQEAEVLRMAAFHDEVREEIEAISVAMERYAEANAVEPNPTLHTFIMASIDYMERIKAGEQPSFPSILHPGSVPADYAQWTNRDDLQMPHDMEAAHACIIGHSPEAITAIVWLRYGAPPEVHDREYEKFLILEGTCDIVIGETVHSLEPGDVFIVPLHATHIVRVTSSIPCKLILQRAAA
jgi:mannose-6-phosphate isomerase-like protein (cupin superfamily)